MDLLAALAGLGFGLSLIVAIGAQNAFVLRQGLRGEHVALVVAVCAISDAILIALGVAGAGALLRGAPGVVDAVRIGGAAFLLGYAVARRPARLAAGRAARRAGRRERPAGDAARRARADVAEPARLPRHGRAARLGRRRPRRRALVVRRSAPPAARCCGSPGSASARGCCGGRSSARRRGARSTARWRSSWARSGSRS